MITSTFEQLDRIVAVLILKNEMYDTNQKKQRLNDCGISIETLADLIIEGHL